MAKVEIYTKSWCPYSTRAKERLDRKGVTYDEIDVTTDIAREREMVIRSARHTVPQVFVDGELVGGSDDLALADASGRLDELLSGGILGDAA